MNELTLDVAALEQLPEVDAVELGGDRCHPWTCYCSCLLSIIV